MARSSPKSCKHSQACTAWCPLNLAASEEPIRSLVSRIQQQNGCNRVVADLEFGSASLAAKRGSN